MSVPPFAHLIDDSTTYGPWLTFDPAVAQGRADAGKRVIRLWTSPDDVAQPGPHDRAASERAQLIVRDAQAMQALRRLRALAGVSRGVDLVGVVDAIAEKLKGV
jgi:hypothetical protein